jgi:endoglucanase
MRWQPVVIAVGAAAVLGGVPAAAALIPHDHPRDITGLVTALSNTPSTSPTLPSSPAPPANPLAHATLYVDPHSQALQAAEHAGGTRDAALLRHIGREPQAFWFGDWIPAKDIDTEVGAVVRRAASASRVPVLVAYDIPVRDCHGYSGGGASSPAAYRSWIDGFARGISHGRAVVILEPDALAQLDCLSQDQQATRLSLLRYAIHRFTASSATTLYVDAGHSGWIAPGTMAQRLHSVDISAARGFALNVSNFGRPGDETAYGHAIAAALGVRTPYVIDTSRDGAGPTSDNAWCNPPGRALGPTPTVRTGAQDVDAFLWVKRPGESDGTCNGGPPAGQFWAEDAIRLAERSPA